MEVFLALSGIGVYGNGSVYDGTCCGMGWAGGVGLGGAWARGGIVQHVVNQSNKLHHSTRARAHTHTQKKTPRNHHTHHTEMPTVPVSPYFVTGE